MIDLLSGSLGALALALIFILGFAAQRAGICTVNAVAELMTTGRARLLASFFKAAAWAAAVYGLVTLAAPGQPSGFVVYAPPALSLAGGFVFGAGSAVNGGCSVSTLHRLADGDLWMGLTLGGMALGLLGWSLLDGAFGFAHATEVPLAWATMGAWTVPAIAALVVLAVVQAVQLWRTRPPGVPWLQRVAAPSWRLSTAALVIGLCGGALYGLKGAWSYTNWLREVVEALHRRSMGPGAFQFLLFASLLGGMLLSALARRSFRLRQVPARVRVRRFGGGALMGLGAGAIPGGNDGLMLTGLPTLSAWALGVYLALLAGVAVVLFAFRGRVPRVDCTGDVCRETPIG